MSQSSYIRKLSIIDKGAISSVGGKAGNLTTLIEKGIRVPQGFVLTTDAYRDSVFESISSKISLALESIDYSKPVSIEEASRRIRALFERMKLPGKVVEELRETYEGSMAGPVAVRSSGTAEDLPEASFAGQYETFLNVKGTDDVLESVKKCYSSLWTDRAIAYRNANSIPHEKVHLAVLVQSMVPARSAGVMFTSSPTSPAGEELMIESNFGLGESVVNGSAVPDRFVVRKGTKGNYELVSKEIGTKNLVIDAAGKTSGVVVKQVSADLVEASSLSDKEVIELARIGGEIEGIFLSPQDVEWAVDQSGTIHILQSRPITTLAAKKKDDSKEILWSRGYADDYWCDNVTPLFYDLLGDQITYIVNIELNDIMGYKGMPKELLKLFQAHVYFNLEVIKNKVVNEMPTFIRSEDLLNIFPEGHGPYGKETMRNLPFAIKNRIMAEIRVMLFDSDGSMTNTDKRYREWTDDVFVPYLQEFDSKLKSLDESSDLNELLRLAKELDKVMMRHFRMVRYGIPVHNLGMSLITNYLLQTFLSEQEASQCFPLLISGLRHKTTETNDAINSLASLARASPVVKGIIEKTDSNQMLEAMKKAGTAEANEFLTEFEKFSAEYGVRGYTREPYYPRWGEKPSLVFDILKPLMEASRSSIPTFNEVQELQQKTELEVKSKIAKQSLGFIKWGLLSAILGMSRKYLCFREDQRFNLDRWITRNRALFLKVGAILTERNVLSDPSRVFFLHRKEILRIAEGHFDESGRELYKKLTEERYMEFKKYEDTVPPKFIQGEREYNDPLPVSDQDGILKGIPASQGEASGNVRVLASIHEIPYVKSGEIIVVPRTDPGWTPVFSKIGGLITETGGVLSHGAVVSREYGIPAVTNIRNVCQTLKTGDYVTINGSEGTVRFHHGEA
ncbi:MAG: hypothetical protein EAX95_15935 [Candidatus Thorarchaeota archaeon]|nr:hypothetical protein [Candidatus Thorarchaeota archaeon]